MNIQEIEALSGDFTYLFGNQFFIETNKGNFVWSDPEYQGDNSITKTEKTLKEFLKTNHIPFGRCKGRHYIKDYCGNEIWVKS